MEEEGGGSVFDQEALEILVDGFAVTYVEFAAAILKEFIDFGAVVAGDVGGLARVPQSVLIRVGRNLVSDQQSLELIGDVSDDFDGGGDS